MNGNDRPLTREALARLAARIEPERDDGFELEGTRTFRSITFAGENSGEAPEIGLRPIVGDDGRETVGWEIVSSKPFTFGLSVRSVGQASLPQSGAEVADELDAFLPAGAAVDDVVEVADPMPIRHLRRRSGQLVQPDWVFPPDQRQTYKPSAKKKSPHSLVGKVQVWLDPAAGPSYAGSAALVSTNAILTAAHVIPWFNVQYNLPWKALFTPAYFDGQSVFTRKDGSTPAAWCTNVWGYPGHSQGDDMAVWRLDAPLGQELGYFGYKTYNDDWEDMPVWRLNGYPGDMFNSERPARVIDFPITDDDDDGAGVELEYKADSSGGMSGGPVWAWFEKDGKSKPYIVGTHSGGEDNFAEEKHNLAAGGSALSALIKWARDNW
jgi:V8-like Glu-specific endopeptidase